MNILPHKSWHVRTKKNIERVRRDEAKAAEDEKRILERQLQAENESRMNLLRKRADDRVSTMFGMAPSSSKDVTISDETGHVNLFQDLEREERKNLGNRNADYEKEKAAEKREWETKMGIQVYFADNTNDLTKKKEWYETLPSTRKKAEVPKKVEDREDFLKARRKMEQEIEEKRKRKMPKDEGDEETEEDERARKKMRKREKKEKKDKKKKKKKKHHKRDSSEEREIDEAYDKEKRRRLQEMREERMRRERGEAARTYALLHPEEIRKEENKKKPKYNSQFMPEISRR